MVRLEPLAGTLPVDEDLLRRAFSARRKTLRNALPGIDFAALGIDPGLRPENLSPEDYARLSTNAWLTEERKPRQSASMMRRADRRALLTV